MQAKVKKTKTIQIKYPAQYSQSWTENTSMQKKSDAKKKQHKTSPVRRNPPLSQSQPYPKEKSNKKEKKASPPVNKTQIVYPLPFTKSAVPHIEKKNSKVRKNSTAPRKASQKVNRAIDPFSGVWQTPRVVKRPDPTVPHLKYGVFQSPKTKPAIIRDQLQAKSTMNRAARSPSICVNKKKGKSPKDTSGDQRHPLQSPLPQTIRQLTISTPTHLDIRPREGWRALL